METLQLALKRALAVQFLQNTCLTAFLRCAEALCAVNESLFENTDEIALKASAFNT